MATEQHELSFVGVVLAGGKSSRMGKDKALLELDGESMLKRCSTIFENLGAERVIVCRNEFTTDYLPDVYPHLGPLSGIHAALFDTELPVLVMPVDMPLADVELLSPILQAGLASHSVAYYQAHPLPIFIPNSKETRKYLERCLSQNDGDKTKTSIKRFLSFVGGVVLTPDNEEKLANANTPDQWQHYTTLNRIINVSKDTN